MKRLTALSLLLVMLCSAFMVGTAAPAAEPEITDPKQLGEVLELREKNSETYRLEDGSYECVIFAEDKYFEDETGELVEISNTVVPEKHTIAGKEYGFTNEANSNRIYFSENEPSVLVSTGKQDLAFSIATDRAVTPVIGGLKDMGEIAEYSLSGDTCFAYMNAFEHTDLVYKVRNGMLKEYIVLNDAAAPREFTFTFDTEGYTVSCTEYGTVGFYDSEGELVFELGDLFAVDSTDAYTDELTYTIGETVDGKTDITVTLSEDYAADPERAYPILVDPSVMISGADKIKDSFVSSNKPTKNFYLYEHIRMGWNSEYKKRRTYIRYDLPPSVPSNAITTAYMSLKKFGTGSTPHLKAYRVTGSWTSSTITWNNKPGYSPYFSSDYAQLKTNNWYRFYVTDIVKKWYDGTYQNYGFLVRDDDESSSSSWSTFYSSDADSPNKPELRIRYVDYYGSRPYQQLSSQYVNCMGYALEEFSYIIPTDMGYSSATLSNCTLAEMRTIVKAKAEIWMANNLPEGSWHEITYFDSDVDQGWYRIVLRVGFCDLDGDGLFDNGFEDWDYHWWYQTNQYNGQWAEKMAGLPSSLVDNSAGMDPGSMIWYNSYIDTYYSSDPVYYAIEDLRDMYSN